MILRIGAVELRWYGLLFATGLFLASRAVLKNFRIWGLPQKHADALSLWVPIGMILGAHYIHLIFYEQDGLTDIWPIRQFYPDGSWHMARFWALGSGLSSHGGGLGCFLALALFYRLRAKPHGYRFHRYLDALMVTAIWVFPFVRLGNFANSEIVGRRTTFFTGVIFDRLQETFARHPQQLYEATGNFIILALSLWWIKNKANKVRTGVTFYFFVLCYFVMRFCAEFTKELQIAEYETVLNMGHWLSLPPILIASVMLFFTKNYNLLRPLSDADTQQIAEELRLAEKATAIIDADTTTAQTATTKETGRTISDTPKAKRKR